MAPIGPLGSFQSLTLIEKDAKGKLSKRQILQVRFSPLQGGERI